MDTHRRRKKYHFTERNGFQQPLIPVRLRASSTSPWSPPIIALVDTGAAITLVMEELVPLITGLDPASLQHDTAWQTAARAVEQTRSGLLDICLGIPHEQSAIELTRRRCNFTKGPLVAPILLGQRGLLDALHLVHANYGDSPFFLLQPG